MQKKRAYGYARVSSEAQKDSGLGIESQKNFIKEFYERRFADEYELIRIFIDEAESAAKYPFPKRTEGSQLYMVAGKDDLIIINKMDRIFRNVQDSANTLEHFKRTGVRIVSPEFGAHGVYDSKDTGAWLLMQQLSTMAELGARQYSDRMVDFRKMCAKTGRATGGFIPLGFMIARDRNGDGWYQPDPKERELMRRMARWFREERYTLAEIAKFLNDAKVEMRRRYDPKNCWRDRQVWDWVMAHEFLRELEREAKDNLTPEHFVMPNGKIYSIRHDLIPQSKLLTRKQRAGGITEAQLLEGTVSS